MLKNHRRTCSRSVALQLLYAAEITNTSASELLHTNNATMLVDEDHEPVSPDTYALMLLQGIEEHQEEIDTLLNASSQNWALARMPIMDRAILRLAVYEMKFQPDIPLSVSIDEAVELAKQYGGEDESHRFVNGVLGKIALQVQDNATEPASELHTQAEQARGSQGQAQACGSQAPADGELQEQVHEMQAQATRAEKQQAREEGVL